MYSKPTLERFGTFRELTRFGFDPSGTDLLTMGGPPQSTSCNRDDTTGSVFACLPPTRGSR